MRLYIRYGTIPMLVAVAAALTSCGGGSQTTPEAPPAAPPPAASATQPVQVEPAPAPPDEAANAVSITEQPFGETDGKPVKLYVLTNAQGSFMKVTNYGAIVTELHVPDRDGKLGDIVAGYDNLQGYVDKTPYFGATIGRCANRIANGAKFELAGKTYQLAANDPPYHLHGGKKGWDKVVWDVAETVESPRGPVIKLTHLSKDGEEGYPGNVTASVTYTLTNDNAFEVDMEATTDQATLVNMAHHSYWNLGGFDSGPITDEELTLYADEYTPGNPVVASGVVKPVTGTPFDFTSAKPIGKDLKEVVIDGNPPGYDHNWVVDGDPNTLRPVARIKDPKSGRVMTVQGNQPGVMFYAGLFLDGTITGKGHTYERYDAFCLETQKFPNSVNVPKWRADVILEPGQVYQHKMIHQFSVE